MTVWLLWLRRPGRLSQLLGIYDNPEAAETDAAKFLDDTSVDEWDVAHDPVVPQ